MKLLSFDLDTAEGSLAESSLRDDEYGSSSNSSSSSLSMQLPVEMFDSGEGILWVAAKTKHCFQSDWLPVLVLDADTVVVQALQNM
jgi:hypothetical protein